MTPSQQAALEQVAREWLHSIGFSHNALDLFKHHEGLAKLLAAQRAAGLEDGAAKVESLAGTLTFEQCEGCGNYDDVAEGSRNDAYRYAATQLRHLAQEQRP